MMLTGTFEITSWDETPYDTTYSLDVNLDV